MMKMIKMSGLTRMHFNAISKILGKHDVRYEVVEDFMDYFARMNPRFDRLRFETSVNNVREERKEVERKMDREWFLANHDEVSPGLWLDKKNIFERLKELERE